MRDKNEDDHEVNVTVPHFNLPEPIVIAYDGQKTVVSPLVICLAGLTPYESGKAMPYKYNAIMVEDDKEMLIPDFLYVENIADVSCVTRSGQIFANVAPKRTEDVLIEKSTLEKTHVV